MQVPPNEFSTVGDSNRPALGQRNPVLRTLRLLQWMAESSGGEVGIRQMAASLRMPPSTVHRLLGLLESQGMVTTNRFGRYELGSEFLRMASRVTVGNWLREAAVAPMRELAAQSGELVLLGAFDPGRMEMMFVMADESRQALRSALQLNRWLALDTAIGGLAILAFLTAPNQPRAIGAVRVPGQGKSLLSQSLQRPLERIRRRGFVTTYGHGRRAEVGVAAPIFGRYGHVVGDVVLAIPQKTFDPANELAFGHLVIHAAHRISSSID